MGRTVVQILSFLHAIVVTDVTVEELPKVATTPKAIVVYEQMRARGELRMYSATCGLRSTTITTTQRNALLRAGAKQA